MPTHHNLDRYLEEYIAAAGIADDRKGPLFRTTRGRSAELTNNFLLQPDVWRMIRRRALAAGIKTEIGCHTVIPSLMEVSGVLVGQVRKRRCTAEKRQIVEPPWSRARAAREWLVLMG